MVGFNPLRAFGQNAQILNRNLQANQKVIDRTLERLSSGLRINRAADDPVGITQAKRLQTDLISNRQAIDNTQQAISLVDEAAAGVQQVLGNLQRLRELSLASLSDTVTSNERSQIQSEFSQLLQDTERRIQNVDFNGRKLLEGSLQSFRDFSSSTSEIVSNFVFDTQVTGTAFSFLTGNVTVNPAFNVYDRVNFQTQLNPDNSYRLLVSSANEGLLTEYNDIASAPYTFNLSLNGGVNNVSIQRAPYDFERVTGPLTAAELNKPLEQLVNNDRVAPINYGTLSLGLGPNSFNVSVTPNSTLQGILTSINALSAGPNTVTASYNSVNGRFSLNYSGQAQNTRSNTTNYSVPIPGAAGGPFANFAGLGAPPQGPAYRDIVLPATGFSIASPPANFPSLPGSLNTSFDYSGTDNSLLSALGLANAGNLGTVTAYTSAYYGETVATANPSEYVNRTRAVISDLTAQQNSDGSNTGLSAADASDTFRVLNTATVTAPAFASGDFSIDFGSNGVFTFAGFDPNSDTIQDVVDAVNSFAGAAVTAAYDDASDRLTLTNNPGAATDVRVTEPVPGFLPGLNFFDVDFGDNGSNRFSINIDTDSIQSVVDQFNAYGAGVGGAVSASFDTTTDRLTITNTSAGNNAITFSADPAFNDFQRLFKLSNAADTAAATQSIVSATDIDNSSTSAALDITNASAQTFSQLISEPIAISQDNQISFGGTNGAAIASFFKLSSVADDGSGSPQTVISSAAIDNGALAPSLELSPADRTGSSFNTLRTPRLDTLIQGPLVINGETLITIDPDSTRLTDVVSAINSFSAANNRSYSASFDTAIAGGLRINVQDTESLSNALSQPAANPAAASATGIANQFTLDSAAYLATGAPVFQQTSFAATPLTPNAQNTPYAALIPNTPNVSAIQFGGSSNLASVLFLNNAASGAASTVSDEFRGTATATSQTDYELTAEQRRTFAASSSTTSTQAVGFDGSAINEANLPANGVLAEVQIFAQQAAVLKDQSLAFQLSGREGEAFRLGINDLSPAALKLESLSLFKAGDTDLQSRLRGNNALTVIDQALDASLNVLSSLGATQRTYESQLNALQTEQVNTSQALSNLQDADLPTEISQLTRAQVGQQVSAALLADNAADTRSFYDLLFGPNTQQNPSQIQRRRF